VVDALRLDVLPTLTGSPRYQVQVCLAALDVVRRELSSGTALADADRALLEGLGVDDEQQLVGEIRDGLQPDRFAAVVRALTVRVEAELAIVRPGAVRPS
jgi:hypothetical protein